MTRCLFMIQFFVLASMACFAQDSLSFTLNADCQSRYVWRGQPLGGAAPAIEPAATVSWKGLSFGVWSAFSLSQDPYQEIDWTLSYSFWKKYITLMVTDYSFPTYERDFRYFDYRPDYTTHVLEGGLQFSVPKTDLTLSAFTNFYGNDARKSNGSLVYSTYCEAKYILTIKKWRTDFDFTCGLALNGKDNGFYGNDGFGCVNVAVGATKEFFINSSFVLPVYMRVIANPATDKLYFVAGTTFSL